MSLTATADEIAPPAAPLGEAGSRASRVDAIVVTALATLLALAIGGLMMMFSDDVVRGDLTHHLGRFFPDSWTVVSGGYSAMFQGGIFDLHNDGSLAGIFGPISGSIVRGVPLILAGLGVSLAFRAGLFNIGGEGQIVVGAVAAGWVGFGLSLPPVVHVLVAIVAGALAGGLWGLLAGALKARAGAHEVISTIMLNYVAIFGLQYLLTKTWFAAPGSDQASKVVDGSARLPRIAGHSLPLDFGVVLAVGSAAVVWWLFARSTIGFRLRAVGANQAAARTAGMSIASTTMMAMALAGAFAGLAGVAIALGGATSYQVTQGISSNIGFDAITVALLGRLRAWGTLWAGLLFGVLKQGGAAMQAQVQIPVDIVTVIQALIVIFIAAPRLTRSIFLLRSRNLAAFNTATTSLAVAIRIDAHRRIPRHILVGGTQAVLGLFGIWAFALGERSDNPATFQLSLPGASVDLGGVAVQTRPIALVLCVVVVGAGGLRVLQMLSARWCAVIAVVGLLLSMIFWSVAGSPNGLNVVSLLQGSVFPAAIPLALGALAGIVGERAGVVNVALEGQLLLGAFVAAVVGTLTASAWLGALGGVLAGMLIASMLAVLAIRYLVDQVIVGVVLNVFVLGLTTFLYSKVLQPGNNSTVYNQPDHFRTWNVPGLSDIPIIGPVFFSGTILLYATYVIVIAVHFGLFYTRWGLRVRSVGEHPRAADTVGINVLRTRYRAVWLGGAIAGLGGAFLVVGSGAANSFGINMSAGRGFIALACVIFGRWSPKGAVLAALLFGFADQLQFLLQQAGSPINGNLLLMAPYVVTLFAVAGFVGRVRAPAADGQPYAVE